MVPWGDSLPDVHGALDYLFSERGGRGGFLVLAGHPDQAGALRLVGALAMLATGMGGYVPAHLLVYVSVLPDMRGHGLGGRLVQQAVDQCPGDIKLHVEYDNPAKRLYERLGFKTKYAEMRLVR
ncbi:MAG: GNAT family N-acetyltransferase [Planctomycetota bacterium]